MKDIKSQLKIIIEKYPDSLKATAAEEALKYDNEKSALEFLNSCIALGNASFEIIKGFENKLWIN